MAEELGRWIGSGGACDVYEAGSGKVVKLYFADYGRGAVEWEYNKLTDACAKGLPAPKAYAILQVGDRFGLVMEKVEGTPLMASMFGYIAAAAEAGVPFQEIFASKEVLGNLKITARMLYELHCVKTELIDTAKGSLLRALERNGDLNDAEKAMVRKRIERLPESISVCHGDPNPGNILRDRDQYRWIDWVNAVSGHPFYDLAYFVLMMRYLDLGEQAHPSVVSFLQQYAERITEAFLAEYRRISNADLAGVSDWELPICIDRLSASGERENVKKRILQDVRAALRKAGEEEQQRRDGC